MERDRVVFFSIESFTSRVDIWGLVRSMLDGGALNFLAKGDESSASQDRADLPDIESDP